MSQKMITAFFKRQADGTNTNGTTNSSDLKDKKSDNFQKRVVEEKASEDCGPVEKRVKVEEVETEVDAEMKVPSSPDKEDQKSLREPTPVKNVSKPLLNNASQDAGVDYNPSKSNYDPVNDAFWSKGSSTPYLALARAFEAIEDTKGRLKMIEILGNFFSSVMMLNPDDLLPSVYLSINQLAPAYEGLELGVAETNLMKAICNTTGRDLKFIKSQTQKIGDLGIVAEQSRVAQRRMFAPSPLTISGVFQKLTNIANTTGSAKSNTIQDVFIACRFSEARFFIRSLIGKLRIGIAEQSIIYALATAVVKSSIVKGSDGCKKLRKLSSSDLKTEIDGVAMIIRTAYCQCPNYNKIISTLLEHGAEKLVDLCPMEPGIPIKPMLAQPTKGIHEVLQRFEGLHITCEWKYDGERAQIHRSKDGAISIYSRNQENNTDKYPDVIARISQCTKSEVDSFIVDSEIVAWDVERKHILPFQILSTRKRKNVSLDSIKVQVCVFAFDLLYLNGESLVRKPFVERRELLRKNFQEVDGVWTFAVGCDTNDLDEVQQFLEDSIKGNCEGLMVKTLEKEATYEIAKRSRNWLKLKKDYMSNIGDSLDLVVIGAYTGKGRRTGTYGGFLLACYDEENEEYQSICKIGTGFSDEDLTTHTNTLKEHIITTPKLYYRFDSSLEPDVWFEPVQVWEIKCADLSLSPVHRAAIGITDPERGISLRFPRFIRVREDKSPEDATSAQQVSFMYNSQDQIKNAGVPNTEIEDFY